MKKQIAFTLMTIILLFSLLTGCNLSDDKPLWERLEDTQYNSYKPTLDHLEQKYGEGLFEMDVYGQITLKNSPSTTISVSYDNNLKQYRDNYNIIARKVEFEELMQTIVSSLAPKSKVNLANEATTAKGLDEPLENFLVDIDWTLIRYYIYVPISEKHDCQNFYDDLIAEINHNKYVVDLSIWFVDESVYNAVDSETRVPEKFIYKISAEYNAEEGYVAKWTEG